MNSMMMMKKYQEQKNIVKKKITVPGVLKATTSSSKDLLIQNYANFKRSSSIARCMFYENGSWVDYPNDVAEVMKLGFVERMPSVEAEIGGSARIFDFYRMLEIELGSGNQRSISWIDVNGKCFFPKVFVSTYDDEDIGEFGDDFSSLDVKCPKLEIKIKFNKDSGSSEDLQSSQPVKLSKRKRDVGLEKEINEGSSSNAGSLVKRQQLAVSESQSARWLKTKPLLDNGREHAIVKKMFTSGLEPGAEVTAIHKYERVGPMDKARLEVFEKQMELVKQARGEINMVFAWYGTSAKGVESILKHGFGMPTDSSSNSGGQGPHGVGIYLSPIQLPQNSAMLSERDENGEKHVVLCRVILGRSEKVEAGSNRTYPSSVEYDTGVDNLEKPNWYTVWHANMNTHVLPEVVISYRIKNSTGTGQTGLANANRVVQSPDFITKLLAKMKTCLPQPKLQELASVFLSFKEGKFGRQILMQKIRSAVANDVLLRSIIEEIRG